MTHADATYNEAQGEVQLRDGLPDPRTPEEALRLIAEYRAAPGYKNPAASYLSGIAQRGLALLERPA